MVNERGKRKNKTKQNRRRPRKWQFVPRRAAARRRGTPRPEGDAVPAAAMTAPCTLRPRQGSLSLPDAQNEAVSTFCKTEKETWKRSSSAEPADVHAAENHGREGGTLTTGTATSKRSLEASLQCASVHTCERVMRMHIGVRACASVQSCLLPCTTWGPSSTDQKHLFPWITVPLADKPGAHAPQTGHPQTGYPQTGHPVPRRQGAHRQGTLHPADRAPADSAPRAPQTVYPTPRRQGAPRPADRAPRVPQSTLPARGWACGRAVHRRSPSLLDSVLRPVCAGRPLSARHGGHVREAGQKPPPACRPHSSGGNKGFIKDF